MSAELKYNFDTMSEIMFDHMGQGKSYASLAPQLGVKRNTLYKWEAKYPDWVEAKKLANEMRLLAVEELLLDLATGKLKGAAAAAIFYAKNACPEHFKDKREVDVGGGITYMIDTGIPPKKLVDVEAIVGEIVYEEEQVDSDTGHVESTNSVEDLL